MDTMTVVVLVVQLVQAAGTLALGIAYVVKAMEATRLRATLDSIIEIESARERLGAARLAVAQINAMYAGAASHDPVAP